MTYKKKGKGKYHGIPLSKRCRMPNCKNPICAKTSLCLTHLARRTGLTKMTIEQYDKEVMELTKKFTGRGFNGKIVPHRRTAK